MSDALFTVRPYEAGDEEQILPLFNRVFADENPDFVPRSMDTWQHVYGANPRGNRTMVALDTDGNMIANYSSIPVAVRVCGRPAIATQIVDTCVDMAWRQSLRKASVFLTAARAYQKHFSDPQNPDHIEYMYGIATPSHQRIGARLLRYVPTHEPLQRQARAVVDEAWIDQLLERAGPVKAAAGSWDALPEVGALDELHADEFALGNCRDAAYLGWRFRDWPEHPYRLVLARREGILCGAAVIRQGVPWESQAHTMVVDWIGSGADREATAALLAAVAGLALEAGHLRLETWATPPMFLRATLLSLGLLEDASRFTPAVTLYNPTYDMDWFSRNWAMTPGDMDMY